MSSTLGAIAFSVLPPLIVRTPDELPRIFLYQLAPGLVVTAVTLTMLRERPKAAPSAAAAQQWRESAELRERKLNGTAELLLQMGTLLQNGNFVRLVVGFSIGCGTVWAVLILEAQLLNPCGYSNQVAGVAGAALLASGIAAAFALGAVMEATRAYWELQQGIMALALAGTVAVRARAPPLPCSRASAPVLARPSGSPLTAQSSLCNRTQ